MHYFVILAVLFQATCAYAAESTTTATNAGNAVEDCSKQTWPNFSQSCLKNADHTVIVRIVTVTSR